MKKTYVIGDVHGCYETLLALINKLEKDSKIIFVGDLIDRGPKSKEVVEFVKNNKYDCVLGNHELFMIKEYEHYDEENFSTWGVNGGKQTMDSYKGDKELIKEHIEWFNTLPLYLEYFNIKDEKGRHLVVTHSNVTRFFNDYKKIINSKEEILIRRKLIYEDDILWGRTFSEVEDNNFFNIFGHTITSYAKEMYFFDEWKITKEDVIIDTETGYADIDTGCFNKKNPNNGFLTAIEFPSLKVIQQRNLD